jgi:Fe-Mn family superoxide dismutase
MPLPFDPEAVVPAMSAETLTFHYGKHHQAYLDKTNKLAGDVGLGGHSLLELIAMAGPGALFENACQLWNHNFFWQCLVPHAQEPAGKLMELIISAFGSTDALLKELTDQAVAHFGSGWVWLVLDQGALRVTTYHDGDTPAAHTGATPLFTLDLWEHAYYIDYRNLRPKYVETFFDKLVNWGFAEKNFA